MVLGNHSVVGDCSSAGVSEFLGVRGLLGAPELWASGDSFFSPTGTVTFKDGRTLLGTASLNGGEATFTTNGLAPGSHSIAVQNGGNGDFLAGDSPALTLTVSVIASSFPAESVLTASVRSSANGKPVTLTDTEVASRCQALFLVFVRPERRETSAHGQAEKRETKVDNERPRPRSAQSLDTAKRSLLRQRLRAYNQR